MVDDEFMGRVKKGMKLVGRQSGAEAIVQEIKLLQMLLDL